MEMNTTPEENKRIVLEGLRQRKLEAYERDMISHCNKHCANAKAQRERSAASMTAKVQMDAQRAARVQAKIEAQHKAQEQKASHAFRSWCTAVIVFLWLTTWTHLPLWAAITAGAGLGVFLLSYLYRVFVPLDAHGEVTR